MSTPAKLEVLSDKPSETKEPLVEDDDDDDDVPATSDDELEQELGLFSKNDDANPIMILANTMDKENKPKVVVEQPPELNIPLRPDPAKASANLIVIHKLDLKHIRPNTLGPKEQEKEDEPVVKGIRHLLNNRFMMAKSVFEEKADSDPLYALALSSMATLKAIMTSAEQDQKMALDALNAAYEVANAQIDAAKKPSKLASWFGKGDVQRPSEVAHQNNSSKSQYLPNGVMRAHVIKAECCLQMAILQLLQESIVNYVKFGLNLRRAYNSYNLVWQEYKKMGSTYKKHMDNHTVSGVQFGIGSVHLVLSVLPAKALKAMSVLGWKPDRKLGFELLKQSASSKRVRSSMATMMLLAYFTAATSFAPHLYAETYIKQAMDTLLEEQKHYPNSALYLFFAGRVARLANDLALSTRSFLYAADISKNEWAEVAVVNACRYEIAINHMLTANWEQAAEAFDVLCEQNYWSPAFCKYMQGCCYEMLGRRSEAILAFATVESFLTPSNRKLLVSGQGGLPDIDTYAQRKVAAFQQSGYQDLDFYLPALEFLCIWNQLPYVTLDQLHGYVDACAAALKRLDTREKDEYSIRLREFAPDVPLPDYYNQRAALLFIQSALQNALGDHVTNIEHLNWIVDHKDKITDEAWTVPYAYWEAGIAYWQTDRRAKSRDYWEASLAFGKFDFEHRLAVRMNLALCRCDDLGFTKPTAPETPTGKRSFSFSK